MQRISQTTARRFFAPKSTPVCLNTPSSRLTPACLSTSSQFLAHSDYGSGEVKDGVNPSRDKEHPGPPPPNIKNDKSGAEGDKGKPALHSEPKEVPELDEAARQHNEELDQRFAKSHHKDSVNDPKDKVSQGYWKGEGDQ